MPLTDAVLKLRLLGLHLASAALAEEEAEGGRDVLHALPLSLTLALAAVIAAVIGGAARGDGDIDDGGRDAGGNGLDSVVEVDERGDAGVVHGHGCAGGVDVDGVVIEVECSAENEGRDAGGGQGELTEF